MLDKEFHIRFTLSDVGKAICFSPVIVVLVYVLICLPWDSENAAGWVQAVGSIVAILAAIYIASHQHRLDQARRELEDAQREVGLSLRLNSFAVEFQHYVNDVLMLEYGLDAEAADLEFSAVLERMLRRLDSHFDEDLDHERQELINAFRRNIVGLIYLLKAPFKNPAAIAVRSRRIQEYRSAATGSLIRTTKRLGAAVKKLEGLKGVGEPQ